MSFTYLYLCEYKKKINNFLNLWDDAFCLLDKMASLPRQLIATFSDAII